MKKLMVAAACAAMIGGAYAACAPGEDPVETNCAVVFDLSASGKISGQNSKDTYKANQSLSAKGYLTVDTDYAVEVLANFKYQGKKTNAALVGEVNEWGAYGKYLETFEDGTYKAGKTYKFDSDFGVVFDGTTEAGLTACLSTFGSLSAKVSKGSTKITGKGTCGPTSTNTVPECAVTWTPGKYTGYLAGYFEACSEQLAPEFVCVVPPVDCCLIGAKVTLKYNKKLETIEDAQEKFFDKYEKSDWETAVSGTDLSTELDADLEGEEE